MDEPGRRAPLRALAGRTAVITATVVAIGGTLWLTVVVIDVLLLVFAGLLFGVLLSAVTELLVRWTRVPHPAGLALTVLLLMGGLAGTGLLLWPSISAQADQLVEQLPSALDKLRGWLDDRAWGAWLLETAEPTAAADAQALVSRATRAVVGTGNALAAFLIIIVVGLYVSSQPDLYRRGVLRLVPVRGRARADEVLREVAQVLRWWLLGTLLSMTVVGTLTTVGLWWLDVPLALTFGLLAAALTFIPNIGPALSVLPPALLALAEEPMRAVWVMGLYLVIQTIESYAVTPIIQKRTVELPPALTITAQVALGTLVGAIGLLVATPLTAAVMTVVRMLVVEDLLERPAAEALGT